MSTPDPVDTAGPLPPEVELLALTTLAAQVRDRIAVVKAVVGTHYQDGDKHTFRSPLDDARLGQVYRTDPEPTWRVVDPDMLHRHLRHDPANMETVHEITDHQGAIEALRVHAPHLLAEVNRVSADAADDAVHRAAGGDPVPGVEKVKPAGVLTVKPDKAAAAVIGRMVEHGVLTWDMRPALPAGPGRVAS